ncbi:hypothetical protein [Streptomyces sp. NPDC005017]|uniref:hypothetical protein n=1 Tax=Streptomyces sp. NPDC005017 TaxID=3364706 RepID=UPI0036C9CE53
MGSDRPAAAALLRLARRIVVPAAFTDRQLDGLAAAWEKDPRLRLAVRLSGGRVTQYLAGAPELEARYRQADETVQAVVHAAVDARRLGHTAPLPGPFLRDAAAACLPEDVWAQVEADWFDSSLDYLSRPCRGVPGILIEYRPRTGELSSGRTDYRSAAYRLADYIEQVGRRERGPAFPPAGFWDAAARTVADTDMLGQLAEQAAKRLRYGVAARLLHRAAQQGSTSAYARLAQLCCAWRDYDGAEVMATRAAEEQHVTAALCHVAAAIAAAGDTARAARLYERAAEHGDSEALKALSRLWARAGEPEKADAVKRAAARSGTASEPNVSAGRRGNAAISDTVDLWRAGHRAVAEKAAHDADGGWTLSALAQAAVDEGDAEAAERLYRASAARGGSYALRDLTAALWRFGDRAGAEAAARDAAVAGNIYPLRGLADQLYSARDLEGAERLYRELAERGDAVARSLLAEMNVDAIEPEAALAAARNGDCVELRVLANRALLCGDYDLAEQFYRELMDDDPVDALLHIAIARARADDLAGAESAARAAAEHGDAQALSIVARDANLRGDVRTAERLDREHNDWAGSSSPESIAQYLPEAQAEQLRRYGLEPDGALSPPWSCAELPPA